MNWIKLSEQKPKEWGVYWVTNGTNIYLDTWHQDKWRESSEFWIVMWAHVAELPEETEDECDKDCRDCKFTICHQCYRFQTNNIKIKKLIGELNELL